MTVTNEHICGNTCPHHGDETKDFTLTVFIPVGDGINMLLPEAEFLFKNILLDIPDVIVQNELIIIPISNAELLAKILTKLHNRLSNDLQITSYRFQPMNNNLEIEVGDM